MQIGEKKVVRIIPDPHLRFGFAHEIDLCCCYSTVLCASSFDADLNANLFSVLLDRLWSLWFALGAQADLNKK